MSKSRKASKTSHVIPTPDETEQDAAWARAEAQAATFDLDQQKARFLAMVSHEIRTPLNGIIGMGKLLSDTKLTAEQRNYVDAMTSSSQALLLLVNDLLEFGQQHSGVRRQSHEHLDVRNCIAGVAELLAGRAHEKGIDLGWRVERSVPAIVCVNAVALRQVLFNVIGNAVKFTEKGGVSIFATFKEGALAITISDTGPGISDEDKASVFDAFHQLDMSHTRTQEGAGLGLAISKKLLDDIGGDIALMDADDGGARFEINVPVEAVPAVFEEAAIAPMEHIFVYLDMDNGPERQLLADMLSAAGVAVSNADQAGMVFVDMRRAVAKDENLVERWVKRGKKIAYLIEPQQRGTFGAQAKANGHSYLTRPVREESLMRLLGNEISGEIVVTKSASSQGRKTDVKLRVLLIEDNEINAMLASRMLEREGHSVTLAANGKQALDLFAPGTFEIVLTDLHMPETSGFQVVSSIRRIEDDHGASPVVIVGVTADESEETRRQFFDMGAQAVLTKPFDLDQFGDVALRFGLL